MIDCEHLAKRFGSLNALDGINLSVEAGAPIGLVGPNGAGKTTLFSILCGFLPADEGKVEIFNEPAGSSALKGKIGVLPQDARFLKGQNLEPQLRLFAKLQGLPSRAAEIEADKVMEMFEIIDLAKRQPERLSFGQNKRCALAQAMIGSPPLVLLDEPTSGLDPVAAEDVRRLIRKHSAKSTFIISSHNLAELQDICEKVIVMNQGKVIAHERISELLGQHSHLSVLLDARMSQGLRTELEKIPAIVQVEFDADDDRRIMIQLESGIGDDHDMQIMGCIKNHGNTILEFNRGKKLSHEISELIK